jgi:CBS domain-containing protein
MQVSDLMTPAPGNIRANATVRDAALMMREGDVGALLVSHEGRLIGMITDRDIAMRAVADNIGSEATVREVMSEGLSAVLEDASLEDCAHIMAKHQVRRLPVINHQKQCVGIVSLADLAQSGASSTALAVDALDNITRASETARA